MNSFSLENKVIVLTGGAGLFGRGLVTAIAATGAKLVAASRNVTKLEAVAAEETAKGRSVVAEKLDQGDEASVLALRDRVLERFGR
ncbi:MAG: SDR family NAD(P)-dependent oxidoreductase, partial [Verrucomicrobiia bacterium]